MIPSPINPIVGFISKPKNFAQRVFVADVFLPFAGAGKMITNEDPKIPQRLCRQSPLKDTTKQGTGFSSQFVA
jgi:hypothetical protein